MKVLIISNPKKERLLQDEQRFSEMNAALQQGGLAAKHIFVERYEELLEILDQEKADLVFSADYYVLQSNSQKVNIASILDELNIPYIGSEANALELVLSKSELKRKWQEYGINTPEFFTIEKGENQEKIRKNIEDLSFPLIIKPDNEGNSRGLDCNSVVFDFNKLMEKVTSLLDRYDKLLIERYLGSETAMSEYTVALIGNLPLALITSSKIVLKVKRQPRLITTMDKDAYNALAIPNWEPEIKEQLSAIAEKAFKIAGVRDYSRFDLIKTREKLYAIEINGQPMIPDKWFEACTRGAGLNKAQYINAVFFAGIQRINAEGKHSLEIPKKNISLLPEKIRSILSY